MSSCTDKSGEKTGRTYAAFPGHSHLQPNLVRFQWRATGSIPPDQSSSASRAHKSPSEGVNVTVSFRGFEGDLRLFISVNIHAWGTHARFGKVPSFGPDALESKAIILLPI